MKEFLIVAIVLLVLLAIGVHRGWFTFLKPNDIVIYSLIDGSTRATALKMIDQLQNMGIKCNLLKVNNTFKVIMHDVYYESPNALVELGALLGNIEGKESNL